ncbi:MAG TPA: bifunctional diaminohydroxyphosphoribosylaminopyrimidine deaminase/5-amino-6-(5-phosphoribosylamino)uracil reductase RibD [Candidatus Baltobacteraceae bacterium]|nr:bifunctional diaminohydroxyphosphoribosylaminopyrimidine deaminase/5-amino-6-(5-phosphoribosylamino)uracil reductase RibD [Candidatus Baltobacteraceae bacterium]
MTSRDRLFMERAYELAARGVGSVAPNPAVGAVIVRDGKILGEGFHHRAGEPHGEANALAQAGDARGATVYVTLEPCNHVGRTPACARALIDARVARVVVGTPDPNPKTNGGGILSLRAAGIAVEVLDDARARRLIEPFAFAIRSDRSYVALKMAMSLDGRITSRPGVQEWITCEEERAYVGDLRFAHDAVMVGAGTVRVDDPQLTVRPARHRVRPFTRIVACETAPVPASSRVFAEVDDYARTLVLAPAGARERFAELEGVAELAFVGDEHSMNLDLALAMQATRAFGVQSILCEGGPTLGARLIASGLVERVYWAIAPRFLTSPEAVPVLAGADLANLAARLRFDSLEHVGEDVMLSGRFDRV